MSVLSEKSLETSYLENSKQDVFLENSALGDSALGDLDIENFLHKGLRPELQQNTSSELPRILRRDLKRLNLNLGDLLPRDLMPENHLREQSRDSYIKEALNSEHFSQVGKTRKEFYEAFVKNLKYVNSEKEAKLKMHLMQKGFWRENNEGRFERHLFGRVDCFFRAGVTYPLTFIFQTAKILLKGVFCIPVSLINRCFKVEKLHSWTCTGVLKDFLFWGKIAERIMACTMGVIFAPPKDYFKKNEVTLEIKQIIMGKYNYHKYGVSFLRKQLRLSIPNYKKMIFENDELFNYKDAFEYVKKFGRVKSG